jgi:hypothetical protein
LAESVTVPKELLKNLHMGRRQYRRGDYVIVESGQEIGKLVE